MLNHQPEQTAIQSFTNPTFGSIRTAGTAENPLFCLADICKAVGLRNPRQVKSRLDAEDVQLIDLHAVISTDGSSVGNSMANFVTESGLYDVILQSSSQSVKAFRKWITSQVLPSIRKTGGYIHTEEADTDAEIMAKALLVAQKTIEEKAKRISALTDENAKLAGEQKQMLPKVAAYEQVINTPQSEWLKTTQQVANELGMSAQRLYTCLIAAGVLYRTKARNYLITSNYAGWDLHKIVSHQIDDKHVVTYLKWTDRGRLYIRALKECNWDKRRAWHYIKEGIKPNNLISNNA